MSDAVVTDPPEPAGQWTTRRSVVAGAAGGAGIAGVSALATGWVVAGAGLATMLSALLATLCGASLGAAAMRRLARFGLPTAPAVAPTPARSAHAPTPVPLADTPPNAPTSPTAPTAPRRPTPPAQPVRAFSSLADAVPHLLWQADVRGVVVHANQSWLRTVRTVRPLRVEDLIEVMADDDAGDFIGAWDAAQRTGSELRLRCRLRRPGSGELRWTDVVVRPLRDAAGAIEGWLGTCTDVHDAMVKIESAQQSLREERRQRETAERLAIMKDEFLATVSHELRSPLNAISGWSEILSRERGLAASAVHAIGIIQRNARSQAKLITDLQQLASMLTGKVALATAEFDLGNLAQRIVSQHAASAAAKRIRLVCVDTQLAPVHGDAARIGQAIANLLSNAIKYTPENGCVDVAVHRVRDSARLTVADNGRGIAAERLPQLFDCLRPLDVSSDSGRPVRRDGLGLGLAVARGLVELHDGIVQAESDGIDAGSVFTITLPLSTQVCSDDLLATVSVPVDPAAAAEPLALSAPPREEAEPHRTLTGLAGLTVLVLDADGNSRALICAALASLGARPVAAADAAGAAEALRSAVLPDALLCDAALAANDAVALRNALNAQAGAATGVPTIALQAADGAVETSFAGMLPCAATLQKPVSLRRLAAAILAARTVNATPAVPPTHR